LRPRRIHFCSCSLCPCTADSGDLRSLRCTGIKNTNKSEYVSGEGRVVGPSGSAGAVRSDFAGGFDGVFVHDIIAFGANDVRAGVKIAATTPTALAALGEDGASSK